jgi:beta-lactamase class A
VSGNYGEIPSSPRDRQDFIDARPLFSDVQPEQSMRSLPGALALLTFSACRSMHPLDAGIDAILAGYPEATVAVAVYDPATGTALDRLGDRPFHAASTMKVAVMIEVYRLAEAGRLSLDEGLRVENHFRSIVDGSPYRIEDDSDDAIYERLGQSMTIRDLVFQMITVSSNLATNLLIDRVGADSVQATIDRLGVRHMKVRRGVEDLKAFNLGLNNTTTAGDLALLLRRLMEGTAVSPSADAAMRAVLLEQAFDEMIPAGLPAGTPVAHKTGQITAIHHDAAIVYPPLRDPFVLVILIEGLTDSQESAALGASIAKTVFERLRVRG